MSCRCGIIGSRPGPSSMLAPCPLAHQWIGSTPFEKKTMPSRSGGVFAFSRRPPPGRRAASDSIQGSASATPMPRRKWRRDG